MVSKEHLVRMTDEQRQQAKEKRISDQEYARQNYKTEYADEKYWRDAASKYNLRLPGWWLAGKEVKYMRRACKKVGVEISDFIDSTGFINLNQLVANNPRFTALALVGLVLEYKESEIVI